MRSAVKKVKHHAECRAQNETFAPVPSFDVLVLWGHTSIDRVRERGHSCPRSIDGRLENRPSYSKIMLVNVTAEPVSSVNA
ncbi:MAG: hypothetical protein HW419_2949 [Deltaproteobacteria bacterium]|nr:hypothetical protein [Deltaproteobacteria bacterium]